MPLGENFAQKLEDFLDLDEVLQVVLQIARAVKNRYQEVLVHDEVPFIELVGQAHKSVNEGLEALVNLLVVLFVGSHHGVSSSLQLIVCNIAEIALNTAIILPAISCHVLFE